MKAYPAYIDSGIEWLGEFPAHWKLARLKHIMKSQKNAIKTGPFGSQLKNSDMEGSDVKVYNQRSVIDNDFVYGDKYISTEKFEQLKEFEIFPGDILITTRGTIGKCAIFPDNADKGILHPCLIRIQPELKIVDNKFLLWFIQESTLFKDSIFYESNATTIEVIYSNNLRHVTFPLPPLIEQQAIANFLDRKTAQIDRFIERKQRQIELLHEQVMALVNQMMSKGQDRKNIIKDNCPAPWLFPLPSKWKRQKIKFNSYMKGRIGYQNLRSEEYADEGPYLVSSVHFKDSGIEWGKCNHVTRQRFEMAPEIILQEYDVLFMKDGALMGKLAFVGELPGEACLNSHLLLMRPIHRNYLPRFLYYVLMTDFFEAYMIEERKGTTFFGFSQESMGNYPLSFPTIEEQEEICKILDEQTDATKKAIGKINHIITLLQDYRTAIISQAVTGKIDVREYKK